MMIEPPIEELVQIVGDKYKLCCLAAKRALEIQKLNYENHQNPEIKEITEAANEIYNKELKSNF